MQLCAVLLTKRRFKMHQYLYSVNYDQFLLASAVTALQSLDTHVIKESSTKAPEGNSRKGFVSLHSHLHGHNRHLKDSGSFARVFGKQDRPIHVESSSFITCMTGTRHTGAHAYVHGRARTHTRTCRPQCQNYPMVS